MRSERVQKCGCGCGFSSILTAAARLVRCFLPYASGLEALTVVEWRMQLLLKSKHRDKGAGSKPDSATTPSTPMSKPPSRSSSRLGLKTTASRDISHDESPVKGAAAFHPDCQDNPHNHHHHYLHRHHYHDHTPLGNVDAYEPGRSINQTRRQMIDPADGIDPRFTKVCHCGGKIYRESSRDQLYRQDCAIISNSDPGQSGMVSRSPWYHVRSKTKDDSSASGGRKRKEGRSKLRRHFDFSVIMGFFRPRKVSIVQKKLSLIFYFNLK